MPQPYRNAMPLHWTTQWHCVSVDYVVSRRSAEEWRVMSEQVWFVTGSSRGLGRAVVEEALAAGHRVVATARRREALADLEEKYGDQVCTLALDVSDAGQAAHTVQAGLGAFGRRGVIVNNEGYANLAPVEEVDPHDFRTQIETVFF